jgi:hypothetical protein
MFNERYETVKNVLSAYHLSNNSNPPGDSMKMVTFTYMLITEPQILKLNIYVSCTFSHSKMMGAFFSHGP